MDIDNYLVLKTAEWEFNHDKHIMVWNIQFHQFKYCRFINRKKEYGTETQLITSYILRITVKQEDCCNLYLFVIFMYHNLYMASE